MNQKPRKEDVTHESIHLPQEIIESFARYLAPEIRAFYKSEEGQQAFKEWVEKQENEGSENSQAG